MPEASSNHILFSIFQEKKCVWWLAKYDVKFMIEIQGGLFEIFV